MTVSEICMGTMTFGSYCDEATSFQILDRAYQAGINFYDTAEIYPVPPDAKYVNETERIFGRWMQGKPRESLIVATKVAGPGHGWFRPPLRSGLTALDRRQIRAAVEGSLQRLQTDYIDLYQTHWPDHDFGYEETLRVLDELVGEGKIRAFGCSNESAWGLMKSLWTSDRERLRRHDSIQNNFSLLCKTNFEEGLADVCRREQVSLLPYSPLAGGVLTGKYLNGQTPEGARFSRYLSGNERQKRIASKYCNDKSLGATAELNELAKRAGHSLTTLAVAWSKQHDFVASTIIGATSVEQLNESLQAADVILPDEVMREIDLVLEKYHHPVRG